MRDNNMFSTTILIISCFIISSINNHVLANTPKYSRRARALAPALYVLGDSGVDNGNNNFALTLAKTNYWPYGVIFPEGTTGRFTNGRTVADFIAEYLGLPYSPAYKSIHRSKTLTGLNYASGASGILPITGIFAGQIINLDEQIHLFEKTVKFHLRDRLRSTNAVAKYLSSSIFIISIGANDYVNNYLMPIYGSRKKYSLRTFVHLLIDALSHKLEKLYNLGVRKVVVFEVGPAGCVPSIKKQYKQNGKCVEDVNNMIMVFNYQLGIMLKNLTSTLGRSAFVLGRVYSLGHDVIANPSKYGLEDTSNPCCTTWATGLCIPSLAPCPNMEKHFFWDGYHPTEMAYSIFAKKVIDENIKQLVGM